MCIYIKMSEILTSERFDYTDSEGLTRILTPLFLEGRDFNDLLDKFVKYQNGDLVTSFANPDLKVNIDDYKNTEFFPYFLAI